MYLLSSITCNIRKGKLYFILGIIIISVVLIATELIHELRGIPYGDLTRDPNAISLKPKYIGFVSQIGIFFWFGSVTACLMGSIFLKRFSGNIQYIRYLQFFSFFSFILGVDDVFMLHEESAHRGINEVMVYIIYIICFIFFILRFWTLVFKTNFPLLFISGFFLAGSIFMDKFYSADFMLEDSLKLSGIVFWFLYFFDTTLTFIFSTNSNREIKLNHKSSFEL
jgi:hypothetical protein